jgi:hypothetical protein
MLTQQQPHARNCISDAISGANPHVSDHQSKRVTGRGRRGHGSAGVSSHDRNINIRAFKLAHRVSLSTPSAPASPCRPSVAPLSVSHKERNRQPASVKQSTHRQRHGITIEGLTERRTRASSEIAANGRAVKSCHAPTGMKGERVGRCTSRMTSRTKLTRLFSFCKTGGGGPVSRCAFTGDTAGAAMQMHLDNKSLAAIFECVLPSQT